MKYSILGYLIGEGFKNLLKNKKQAMSSLTIMFATMFVLGVVFLIVQNVQDIISQVEEQQAMQVFITLDTDEQSMIALGNEIKSLEYVNNAEFVSKEDALNTVKTWFKDNQDLVEPFAVNNPFKASYIVTLTDLEMSQEVLAQVEVLENVESITVRSDTINKLIEIANGVTTVSVIILLLLILVSLSIMTNTIKLALHSRRREISIMKYVGATNGFIRWPFMVEGIIIGLVSAGISLLVIQIVYNALLGQAIHLLDTISISLVSFSDEMSLLAILYLALGIGIGTLGSSISMKKYLEV